MQDTYWLGLLIFAAFILLVAVVAHLQSSNNLPAWINRTTFGALCIAFVVVIYFIIQFGAGGGK